MHKYLVGILAMSIVGCGSNAMPTDYVQPEDEVAAKRIISLLGEQRFDEIEAAAETRIAGPSVREMLAQMAELIPDGDPIEVKLVGVQIFEDGGERTSNLTYQYEFPGQWLIINVAILKSGERESVVGFNVVPRDQSLEEETKFSLTGKSVLHYVTGVFVLAAPLLTIFALATCIRTKNVRRKWLWMIFILVGIGEFSLNWTTGYWLLKPFAIQLFSASAFAPMYGPWTLSFSVPLGAIIFLLRRPGLDRTNGGGR
jgi:hypothetical protein